jgi:molybdopterin-biosynthesis enzyme MoeA-like protein
MTSPVDLASRHQVSFRQFFNFRDTNNDRTYFFLTIGSQPQLLPPQEVSAQVQSQSQPFTTSQEVNNTEVDQKFQFCVTKEQELSHKMEELSSQDKPDIEIEAGFCGDKKTMKTVATICWSFYPLRLTAKAKAFHGSAR